MKSSNKKRYRARVFRRGFEESHCAAAVSGANLLESKADATTDGNYPATSSQSAEYDFTNQSGALQPDTIVNSACQFCNSLCRLKVHLKDGRIIDVLGEPDDPVQAGGFCVKGPMMTRLQSLPPNSSNEASWRREGSPDSKFEPIDWDEALETIATKFLALRCWGSGRSRTRDFWQVATRYSLLVERFFKLLGPNNTDVGWSNDAGAKRFGVDG